jgi:hypothetical protein
MRALLLAAIRQALVAGRVASTTSPDLRLLISFSGSLLDHFYCEPEHLVVYRLARGALSLDARGSSAHCLSVGAAPYLSTLASAHHRFICDSVVPALFVSCDSPQAAIQVHD